MRLTSKFLLTIVIILPNAPLLSAQGKKGGSSSTSASSSPSSTSGGSTSSSSAAFESQMLAFGGLDQIANHIFNKVCRKPDREGQSALVTDHSAPIVIFDQASFASLQSYEAFVENIQLVKAAYASLIPPDAKDPRDCSKPFVDLHSLYHELHLRFADEDEVSKTLMREEEALGKMSTQAAAAAASGLGFSPTEPSAAATSLLSMIAVSSNTESPGSITIPDSSFALALAGKFNDTDGKNLCKDAQVIYPPLFGAGSASEFSSAAIHVSLEKLNYVRTKAHEYTYASNRVNACGTAEHIKKSNLPPDEKANDILMQGLKDADGLYDNFLNSLLQINSSNGLLGSASVIQGFQLASLLAGRDKQDTKEVKDANGKVLESIGGTKALPPAYILLASIVAAGGTERVHKTFWRALTVGDKITYSGGLVVNAALWRSVDKKPLYSDVLRYRADFTRLKKPGDKKDVDKGDNLH